MLKAAAKAAMDPVLITKNSVQPNRNAGIRPKQSRIKTYKPPALGIMALSSPKVSAPISESTPPTTHAPIANGTELPTERSTTPGTRKMPDPITTPTTRKNKSLNRNARRELSFVGILRGLGIFRCRVHKFSTEQDRSIQPETANFNCNLCFTLQSGTLASF